MIMHIVWDKNFVSIYVLSNIKEMWKTNPHNIFYTYLIGFILNIITSCSIFGMLPHIQEAYFYMCGI